MERRNYISLEGISSAEMKKRMMKSKKIKKIFLNICRALDCNDKTYLLRCFNQPNGRKALNCNVKNTLYDALTSRMG